mgnify:CR=1 FL=1
MRILVIKTEFEIVAKIKFYCKQLSISVFFDLHIPQIKLFTAKSKGKNVYGLLVNNLNLMHLKQNTEMSVIHIVSYG